MSEIRILTPADGGPFLEAFHAVPRLVATQIRHASPADPSRDERLLLRPGFMAVLPLAATRSGEPAARLAVFVREGLHGLPPGPAGLIGLYEALDDGKAAAALLEAACGLLRARGVRVALGPMDGDTWHRYRVNAGPMDAPPFLLEPWNPPWYPSQWLGAGFTVLERYYSKQVDDLPAAAAATRKFSARCQAGGYRIRPFDTAAFERELTLLYELSTEIFAGNVLYSPIEREEFLALHRPSRALIRPEVALFALAPGGRPAGFVFAYPDTAPGTLDVKTLGCLASSRGRGLGPALAHETYAAGVRLGLTRANLCLIHEDNVSGRLDAGLGRVSRTYHLYSKPL